MMAKEFGAGIALDEDLDFRVDGTGDLDTTSGGEELSKDLAFQLKFSLRTHIGELISENLKAEVKNTTKTVVELDPRVKQFREEQSTVSFPDSGTETISVTVPIVTEDNESYELIFEVSQ